MKRDAKLEEKLICCFKNYKNSVNFDLNTGSFLNFHFDWFLLCKVYSFLLKKITEELCFMTQKSDAKFEEKLTWFGKWHEKFGKFLPEHLKVSKLVLWWDLFIQSRKYMSLYFTKESCVIINEKWCKIWKGTDFHRLKTQNN